MTTALFRHRVLPAIVVVGLLVVGLGIVGVRAWIDRGMEGTAQHASIHDANAVEASKQIAMSVVAGIEKFKTERGAAPQSLSELVPTYMPSIPLPTAGRAEWRYRTHAKGYTLRFGAGSDAYPGYYYESSTGTWAADF